MSKRKNFATTVCSALVLCLLAVAMPKTVAANGGDDDKPIRLRATAGGAPIGRIVSLGGVAVNGRMIIGEQMLWGGEMLHVLASNGASVQFDDLGQVQLKKGALVRLATNAASSADEDEASRGVIVASLLGGEMNIRLSNAARAYVQSCGAIFTARHGAAFRVAVRDGRAVALATSGVVEEQDPAGQRRYFVRPVGLGASISVRARSTRQIQVQVTDENDRPVPDIPVVFALGSSGAGGFGAGAGAAAATTVTVRTNAQGIATTQYTAGADAATTDLTATVEGTRASWTATLSVTAAAAGFWTPLNTTLVVAGIAAGVATGVVLATRDDDDPINPSGPPVIRPQSVRR